MEFKGSEYALLYGKEGGNLPAVSPAEAGRLEYAALEATEGGLVRASAVIENGGLAAALARMLMAGGKFGAQIDMNALGKLRTDYALFSESAGYVLEVSGRNAAKLKEVYEKYKIPLLQIGKTTADRSFTGISGDKKVFDISLAELKRYWHGSK
jgi:phosphoribosylformylglycinamidine (FGAM) synthase-like enzyme